MKVGHKEANYVVEYEVVEESPSYYIVKHPSDPNSHVCLEKRIYSPSPTEQWLDVTAECSLRMDGTTPLVDHDGQWGGIAKVNPTAPYRLRKVQVNRWASNDTATYHPIWAFLIERREG